MHYFVSRHQGARQWLEQQNIQVDKQVVHLKKEPLSPGDRVIGTLPLQMACWVCEQGAEYWHLSLDIPSGWRGKELTAAEMQACQARLERFHVIRHEDASLTAIMDKARE